MANEYSADVPKGFNVPKQVRLDSITGIQNEETLKDLGVGNNLAFKYYEGLEIYCKDEKTTYRWREVVGSETGLLNIHFVYPTYNPVDGIDYSGKSFNFFEVTNSNIQPPDGSETKLIEGSNITITGTGTTLDPYEISSTSEASQTYIEEGTNITITGTGVELDPYIINSDSEDLGIVKTIDNEVIAPGQSISIINNEATGKVLTTKEYVQSIIPATPDGSETKLNPGDNITITGTGTTLDPYIINSENEETITYVNSGDNTNVTGSGSISDPFIINSIGVQFDDLADVATTGEYSDLLNSPSTKSEFNIELTDGDFLFVGDITQYTNEQAQDAVGNILIDTPTINFTYDDENNTIIADVKPSSINTTHLADNINVSKFINDSDYATKAYADSLVTSIFRPAGDWDASGNTFPITGTGPGDTIRSGDTYNTSVAGTPSGFETLDVGDNFYALIDNPGQTPANWKVFESNTQQATESFRGTAKIATQATIENVATTNNIDIVTPSKFYLGWEKIKTIAQTFLAKITFAVAPRFNSGTANTILYLDSNKDLTSSIVTSTELEYISGVTSAIQTQINSKENTSNKATDFTTVNNTLYPSVQAVKGQFDSYFSNIRKDIVFPALYLPAFSDFTGKTVFKGNANGNTSYQNQAVIITDDIDRIVAKFDNSGRLDMHDYTGEGAVSVLYNMGSPAIGRASHFAFGARNSVGNLNTTNVFFGEVTDPSESTMSSKFMLGYMDNVDTSAGYAQPNKSVVIDANGMDLPMIPIINATELQLKNDGSGSAPVKMKYFANNSVERGWLEMSVNPNSPFEADLFYKTKGYLGTPETTRFKIDGYTGEITAATYTGGATLTGTPTAPTAAPGSTGNQIANLDFVLANSNANGLLEYNSSNRTIWNNGAGNISFNASFGENTLASITSGGGNSGYGAYSLTGITSTGNNSAFGVSAGRYIANKSTILTGAVSSTFIGAATSALAAGGTNETVIGYDATGYGSNTVTLGNTAVTSTYLRGIMVHTTEYTVATLPTPTGKAFAIVTDALAPTYMATAVGGGTVVTPVFYNGTTWVCH